MASRLWRGGALLAVVACGMTAVPAAGVTSARTASVAVAVPRPSAAALAKGLGPSLTAIRLTGGYASREITVPRRGGTVRARLTPGVWALLPAAPGVKPPRPRVVLVKANGSIRTASSLPGRPDGPRVAIGPVAAPGLQMGSGRGLADLFEGDLARRVVSGPCRAYTVVDRADPGFASVVGELTLRSSSRVDPSSRLDYRQAMATLKAWAPTHRLTGSVAPGWDLDGPASGRFRLTSGNSVVLDRTVSVDSGGIEALSVAVATLVNGLLCRLPAALTLTVARASDTVAPPGSVTSFRRSWSGQFRFELEDVAARGATYRYVGGTVTSYHVDATVDACSGAGDWSGPVSGGGEAQIRTPAGGARQYFVGFAWSSTEQLPVTIGCPPPQPSFVFPESLGTPVRIDLRRYATLPAAGAGDLPPRGPGPGFGPMTASWTLAAAG